MSETPYLEDNNRKGKTRGLALFGDKQAHFTEALTETGKDQLSHVENEQDKHIAELGRGLGLTAVQQLELDRRAAQGDWDLERIDRARANMLAASSRER